MWYTLYIFQTMISVRSNDQSLKSQRFTTSGCKDIWIKNLSLWEGLNSFAVKSDTLL